MGNLSYTVHRRRPKDYSILFIHHFHSTFVRRRLFLSILIFVVAMTAAAQQYISGIVSDAKTGENIPFANIVLDGKVVRTNEDGKYSIPFRAGKMKVSVIGYETKTVRINTAGTYNIKLKDISGSFSEAVVTGKRGKYSRKNNPAVELMKKVIAAKSKSDLRKHDYYSFDKYSKMTFAFNEVTDKVFEEGKFKSLPFLKEHVETCNETGKLILPISVDETVTREIYRKADKTEKTIILGQRSSGINDLFNTGDILTTVLKDCFTDVDIYENEVRLLQYPFISPISSRSGISFYRYFIEDTTYVDNAKCIRVDFTPNNPQDFGFSGSLYILADSTYRIKKADLGIPRRSDVNFVEEMRVIQEFIQLPSGEQILSKDDMLVQLKITNFLQKFQVKRLTEYSNFDFSIIPDKTFKFKGNQLTDINAHMQGEDFWTKHRAETLTQSEDKMDLLIRRLEKVKGFKPVLFVAKAFIENFVETSTDPKKPSKVDIGPVNTTISQNFVDGLRLRASAQTTAHFNPNLFLKGYVAYGFKDHQWKGLGEVTYSFNKKAYLPREFPVNNLTLSYNRDVMSASDKFLPTDKDNVFTSFKWTTVDHMMYYETFKLLWDREWHNGLRLKLQARTQLDKPTAALFYQTLDGAGTPSSNPANHRQKFRTTDFTAGITYQPGATYINTKQRRLSTNHDAPIYSLSHTAGIYEQFGENHTFHLTEGSIYKRFWLASWGKIDTYLKGGIQWSKVPHPLLIAPAANLSYIMEDNTFNLIDNMEFLNDRYASLMVSWDMNGKILNRIPLIRKLKWREFIGCNVLWGALSDKNNPFLPQNAGDRRLFYFPGNFNPDGSFDYLSSVMDSKTPYVEAVVGIHNIFKVMHVEYVRRLTYIDQPNVNKWGIRFMFRVTF